MRPAVTTLTLPDARAQMFFPESTTTLNGAMVMGLIVTLFPNCSAISGRKVRQ